TAAATSIARSRGAYGTAARVARTWTKYSSAPTPKTYRSTAATSIPRRTSAANNSCITAKQLIAATAHHCHIPTSHKGVWDRSAHGVGGVGAPRAHRSHTPVSTLMIRSARSQGGFDGSQGARRRIDHRRVHPGVRPRAADVRTDQACPAP